MQRQYIFTKNGFYPENTGEETEDEESAEFLYDMGNIESPSKLTVSGYFLYLVSDAFFKELTRLPELEIARDKIKVAPTQECIERLLNATPYAIGTEFIDEKWIRNRFSELETIFQGQIRNYKGSVAMYLAERNQSLHVPERIFLHLVESKNDDAPFAFIATYASRQSDGSVQHMPLQYALTEYRDDREKLLTLLSSLNRAAEVSPLIAELMESGEMFHTLKFTVDDAYSFLKDIEKIEETGILCRIPNWWRKKNSMLSVNVKLGEEKPSMVGFDALVSLQPSLEVDGVRLTQSEIEQLLRQTEGLAFLKGKWIEVNHEKLRKLLEEMEDIPENLSFRDAVQLEMGNDKILPDVGIVVSNGAWMSRMLLNLREPNRIRSVAVPKTLKATLRPYQKSGYSWLNYMNRLGFGACLADDMGLGKTIQVLTYLEKLRKTDKEAKEELPFLTITTYAMAAKIEPLKEKEWDCLILDEAQAIKNPTTKQTREIKKMKSKMRIAMTGTPIENDLTNLWSLFDFLNHGLLGASKEFHEFCKGLEEHPEKYAKLKSMISPFMLRRVKTDKNIISDLPEKVEMLDYAALSRKQTVLYRKAVSDMEKRVLEAEGIERRGIYEKRERVIVFTQFKEITEYLAEYLTGIFHAKGYVIHGGTPVKRRTEIVEKFQGERYVPFIVLSVKAAGTGLNLTKANHVIHF